MMLLPSPLGHKTIRPSGHCNIWPKINLVHGTITASNLTQIWSISKSNFWTNSFRQKGPCEGAFFIRSVCQLVSRSGNSFSQKQLLGFFWNFTCNYRVLRVKNWWSEIFSEKLLFWENGPKIPQRESLLTDTKTLIHWLTLKMVRKGAPFDSVKTLLP